MNVEQHTTNVEHATPISEMHNLCKSEESLINKLDMKEHRGYVTDDQLKAASTDKLLSAAERHTAEVMLQTQDDLRYQRLGYLPRSPFDGPAAYDPGQRPRPDLHTSAGTDREKITLADVKTFDKTLTTENARLHDKIFVDYSQDIMNKYAKAEPGKRLLPSEVWSAVDSLSKKPNLSKDEKEELDILKYSQEQMRAMYPKGPAPTDHHSPAYREYMDRLDRIPMHFSDLMGNADKVMTAQFDDKAIWDTYGKLHPMSAAASAAAVAAADGGGLPATDHTGPGDVPPAAPPMPGDVMAGAPAPSAGAGQGMPARPSDAGPAKPIAKHNPPTSGQHPTDSQVRPATPYTKPDSKH